MKKRKNREVKIFITTISYYLFEKYKQKVKVGYNKRVICM
jgi:hypothetical protein